VCTAVRLGPPGRYFGVGIDAADLSVAGLAITQTRAATS
jgi:hypothetical protein